MNSTKTISIILCQILILSIIAFAQSTDPKEETIDPQPFIDDIGNTPVNEVNTKIAKLDTNEKINPILEYIKDNINKEDFKKSRDAAELIMQKIISQKAGTELNFKIGEKSTIQDLSISDTEGKDPKLNIKIKDKNFVIPLDKLPKSISGIEIMDNGVAYTTKNNGRIELNDPKYTLTEEGDKLILGKYTGIDEQEHKIEISFSENGRVTIKDKGEIEFSGGAILYDPATKTSFKLKDTKGVPGYVNFYKEGHIVKRIGNNIIVEKEDGLSIDIDKTNSNGIFIISKNGITKENYNDYPSGLDKENSFLIDPENKNIYIPENENAISRITDNKNNYKLFGNPNTPQGGVLLNGTVGIGGGNILVDKTNGATINSGNRGGNTGGGNTGGGNTGGGIGSWLPILLIGAAALAVALLLGGGKSDKGSSYKNQNISTEEGSHYYDNSSYSSGKISTGREATPKTPIIQSTFDK